MACRTSTEASRTARRLKLKFDEPAQLTGAGHVRSRSCPIRRGPAPLHGDLGGRSHRRTAGHLHGRVPREVRRPGASGGRHRRRRADVGLRRPGVPNVGFNAVVGRPVSEYGFEPRSIRRNAPGRMGYRRTRQGHGPQRRLRVAELPVVPAGLRRPAAAAGDHGPRPGAGLGAGMERLAPRLVGRGVSRADHPVPDALAAGPRARRQDDLRERRTRLPRGDVQREPGEAGAADASTPATGTR